jgi:hypothetical protein
MSRPVDEILISWLTASAISGVTKIASHDIETSLPEYGRTRFDVCANGGTYSRKWRRLRASGELRNIFDIQVVEKKPEKVWQVKLVTLELLGAS